MEDGYITTEARPPRGREARDTEEDTEKFFFLVKKAFSQCLCDSVVVFSLCTNPGTIFAMR